MGPHRGESLRDEILILLFRLSLNGLSLMLILRNDLSNLGPNPDSEFHGHRRVTMQEGMMSLSAALDTTAFLSPTAAA